MIINRFERFLKVGHQWMINCTKCFYECLDRFSLFEQTGLPRSGKKPGKSGSSEITLPALESQGIPHVLFKIQEKCVNSVSSRQHQKNIRRRPDFCPAHLFPRSNGSFSSFLRAYFARCQFDGSSLRTVSTWHQFSKTLWYQCNFVAARSTPWLRQPQLWSEESGVEK